jgi:hypothetical protein
MIPGWINVLAIASLLAGLACAAWIAFDEMQHPQYIWIMNLVWPITALLWWRSGALVLLRLWP